MKRKAGADAVADVDIAGAMLFGPITTAGLLLGFVPARGRT